MNDASAAARQLAALGASKGGRARAASLSPEERSRIARSAAQARWTKAGGKAPRREYAVVTPEVKVWMDSDPRVTALLAMLCARRDRDEVLSRIEEALK